MLNHFLASHAGKGSVESLALLLQSDSDMEVACRSYLVQSNKYGSTPLYAALEGEQFDAVDFLLDYIERHKANVPYLSEALEMPNMRGTTPVIKCAKEGWAEPLRRLLAAGVDVSATDLGGCTAVQYAVQKVRWCESSLLHICASMSSFLGTLRGVMPSASWLQCTLYWKICVTRSTCTCLCEGKEISKLFSILDFWLKLKA